jgi:hypothetical protein
MPDIPELKRGVMQLVYATGSGITAEMLTNCGLREVELMGDLVHAGDFYRSESKRDTFTILLPFNALRLGVCKARS